MAKKWEYKVVDLDYDNEAHQSVNKEKLLNALGQEGWKLVAVVVDSFGGDTDGVSTAYLEREAS